MYGNNFFKEIFVFKAFTSKRSLYFCITPVAVICKIITTLTPAPHLPTSQRPFNVQTMFYVQYRNFVCSFSLFLFISHHKYGIYHPRICVSYSIFFLLSSFFFYKCSVFYLYTITILRLKYNIKS